MIIYFTKLSQVWITDLIKSTVLSALIGLPIISMLIYLIKNYAGPHMHLYIWAALFAFSMFMMIIYPDYIATWFNDFKPLHEGELKTKIEELAASVNFPLKGIYVMDGSKRSAHSNAYLTGFLGLKRIVLYDTIEKQMSTEEIVAVLAHEIGHWKYSHIMKTITIEQVYQFIMWYMVGKFIYSPIAYTSMGFTDEKVRPVMVGLMTFMILYTPVSKLLGFARNWLSRYHEYQADKYAVVEHEKHELAPALVAIHRENLSDMDPDPLFSTMKYDHPTLIERLKALEHIKKE
jgi:STE24 endopeptidase